MKFKSDSPPDPQRLALEQKIETLRRDVWQLQLEHDLLKKANELLKKGLGVNLPLLSNREKTLLVDALREPYALVDLFVELGLARSSYFYHRAQLLGADKYAQARLAITEVFKRNHSCYGYRRLRASLGRQQLCLSEKVVQRLMKQEGLIVVTPRRRRYGSYLGEISPAPENLINRDFQAAAPNEKWLTDITEFQIPAGKVYLSPMIDCGSVFGRRQQPCPKSYWKFVVNQLADAQALGILPNQRQAGVRGEVVGAFLDDKVGHVVLTFWVSTISHISLCFIEINRHLFDFKS